MLLLSISFLIFAVRFKERLIAFLHFSTLSCSNDKIVLICARIREFCSKERLRIGSFSVPKSANAAESISASLSFTRAWTAGELRTSQKWVYFNAWFSFSICAFSARICLRSIMKGITSFAHFFSKALYDSRFFSSSFRV